MINLIIVILLIVCILLICFSHEIYQEKRIKHLEKLHKKTIDKKQKRLK